MKKIIIACFSLFIAAGLQAQNGSNSKTSATGLNPRDVTYTPTGVESNLTAGNMTLVRELRKGKDDQVVSFYYISVLDTRSLKKVYVSLSKQSFDSVFTKTTPELSAKYPALNKYISDKKLQMNTEEAWISVLKQYNNSF